MFVWALFLWQTTFDLTKIDVQGLARFKPDAVLTTVGLKTGTTAGKAEFDAACQRLIGSGLFQGCNWKYVPTSATGITLDLQLKEAPADQTVRLTIPGVDDKQLWDWFRTNEPLVERKMPGSDEAIQFYTDAVKRFLKKDIASSIDTNLQTHETTLVFRPANLPVVESVKFENTQAIDAATLEKKLTPIAKGMPFTEYDVKQLLELNIRPMYEELGRLDIAFPSIKAEGGAVAVQVNEGHVFNLGSVKVTGIDAQPKLTAGQIANWRQITDAMEALSATLRNQGYPKAKYKIDRTLNEQTSTVNVTVNYDRGKQFVFGTLKLDGLNPTQESAVRSVWTLPKGAPMNEDYVNEFIKAGFGKLGPEFSGVASQMEPAGDNAMDVVITFRKR